MGRPSVFAPKDPKARYQGLMTKEGARLAEQHRRELAELSELKPKQVSDGDLFDYLARGKEATVAYLAKKNRT
jgi:hypothetical protein